MISEQYFYPTPGGRWAISVRVGNRWISLVQGSYLDDPADAEATLRAIGIPPTVDNLDLYFPLSEGQGRCPTLALLELTTLLDHTNPKTKMRKGEVGV